MSDEKQKETSLGKIYKYNPLLLASIEVEVADSRKELNNNDILVFNYLLKLCQTEIRQKLFISQGLLNFSIEIREFKKLFPDDKDWARSVFASLDRLMKTFVTFKNVRLPKCLTDDEPAPNVLFGEELKDDDFGDFSDHKCGLLTFINRPKNRKDVFKFSFNPVIAYCAWTKTNYTHISLDKMFLLKSKYSQKIYEFIEYYIGLHKKKNDGAISISLGKKELKKLFNLDDKLPFSEKIRKINQKNILERDLSKIYEGLEIVKAKEELIINLEYPKNL